MINQTNLITDNYNAWVGSATVNKDRSRVPEMFNDRKF